MTWANTPAASQRQATYPFRKFQNNFNNSDASNDWLIIQDHHPSLYITIALDHIRITWSHTFEVCVFYEVITHKVVSTCLFREPLCWDFCFVTRGLLELAMLMYPINFFLQQGTLPSHLISSFLNTDHLKNSDWSSPHEWIKLTTPALVPKHMHPRVLHSRATQCLLGVRGKGRAFRRLNSKQFKIGSGMGSSMTVSGK